jgi:hypothetical protein
MALSYINQGAVRRQPLAPILEDRIKEAVRAVYGDGYSAQVYSGGQQGKGSGGKRVGSVRHDHGKAGDIYIVGPDGKRVTGDALAPLGQYWAAKRYGGVGMEMKGGGIHLDVWETPPPGGGMAWNYADKGGRYTPAMKTAIEAGLRGQMPFGGPYVPGAGAQQHPAPPQMAGTPAPALPPPVAIRDHPVGQPPQAAIAGLMAQPPAPAQRQQGMSPMMQQAFGAMAMQAQPQELPPPPPIQGPSPQQANGLLEFVQLLRNRARA